jgi:hypothetical protein
MHVNVNNPVVLISSELKDRDVVLNCAGIFKQSIGARNRVGIGLSYRPARLHRLAELVPWNRFLTVWEEINRLLCRLSNLLIHTITPPTGYTV